jgi:Protein of unknown function (DUF2905)
VPVASDLGRLLIAAGLVLVLAGLALSLFGRLPWLGRLPGDFVIRRGETTIYLPIATCLLLSVVLSLVLSLLRR